MSIDITESVTAEWLEVFDADVAAGNRLADSVFWRLSLDCLPEGVDPTNQRVRDAWEKIGKSVACDI